MLSIVSCNVSIARTIFILVDGKMIFLYIRHTRRLELMHVAIYDENKEK